MPNRSRKSPRPAFYGSDSGGQTVEEWAQDLGAWDFPEELPYAALPVAEPFGEHTPPVARETRSTPYERPTLHPNDPEFRERAILWGRRQKVFEDAYNNNGGAVIALGFERQANERMRARFAAIEEKERLRREREDARIQWCQDVLPDCWPKDDRFEWCDTGHVSFYEDDGWEWCNVDHHGWSMDGGGGWCEFGEEGFWEGPDGFWTGEWEERWCEEDDLELAEAWGEWCQDE